MATEEEETEILNLLDIARKPRDEKRAIEGRAVSDAETIERERGDDARVTSVFFERSWRRQARESLSDVHAAVDRLGAAPAPRPAPKPAAAPESSDFSRAEREAVKRYLGGAPRSLTLVYETPRAKLAEATVERDGATAVVLLDVRGAEVREFDKSAEPRDPAPTAVVPDPMPAPTPAPLPSEATTNLPEPAPPVDAPAPTAPEPPAPEAAPATEEAAPAAAEAAPAAAEAPPAPAAPAAAPAEEPKGRLAGLKGKLPFGKKKEAADPASPEAPAEEKPKGGLKGKLPFGRKKK